MTEGWSIFWATTGVAVALGLAKFAYEAPAHFRKIAIVLWWLCSLLFFFSLAGKGLIDGFYESALPLVSDDRSAALMLLAIRQGLVDRMQLILLTSVGSAAYLALLYGLELTGLTKGGTKK